MRASVSNIADARQAKNSNFAQVKEIGLTKLLADTICEKEHFALDKGELLYVFKNGVYVARGERLIKSRVKRLLNQESLTNQWSSRRANEVIEYISADARELWEHPPIDTVNIANGLLEVKTRKLRPHSHEYLSPVKLPVKYDEAAKCSGVDKFIAQVFPDDVQTLAYEIPAWLMTPDTAKQKAILLLGDGGNGKSTYLAMVTSFIGKRNVWSETLQRLEHNNFAGAGLVGKLANICADLPSTHLQGTSFFKKVVTGDPVTLERKNGHPFDVQLYSRLIFSANHVPRSDDSSSGFFDRWLVIPFNNKFRGARKEIPRPVLDARLANQKELSGLLNRALDVLPGLLKKNCFSESKTMREAWSEFKRMTDPLSVWLDKVTIKSSSAFVVKRQLKLLYDKECRHTGRPPMTDTAFSTALKRIHSDLREAYRTVAGRQEHVWLEIGLSTETPEGKM